MTTPSQAKSSQGGGRTYAWPPTPPHEMEVVSVTRAIGEGLPKPFLIGWAAKVAAECAVNDLEIVQAMVAKDNKRGAVDYIKGARFRDMGAKADRGTIVHAALEAYLAGKAIDDDAIREELIEAQVPEKLVTGGVKMVHGLLEFLFDEEPEIYWSEATVYSRKYEYAGTADVLGRMTIGGGRHNMVLDVKTSKSVYDETALQLCAYGRADFVGLDDGTEQPLFPDGDVPQYGVVVRPTPTGKYEKVVFALTDEVYELYLSCLAVATQKHILGQVRRP